MVPPPQPGQDGGQGYPVRTTEGVLATRRAVCLLRSGRRTFLYQFSSEFFQENLCDVLPLDTNDTLINYRQKLLHKIKFRT